MRYIIHNKHLITPQHQQIFFEQEVDKKVKGMEEILRGYKKDLLLDVFIKKNSSNQYHVAASLRLKSKWLLIEKSGFDAFLLINENLDALRNRIKEQLSLERREYLKKRKHHQLQTIGEQMDKLSEFHEKGDKEVFEHILSINLPSLRNYIKRRLKMAQVTGAGKSAVVSLDDLVGEVYTKAFELFEERPDEIDAFVPWLYQLADDLLEKHIKELLFENEHKQSLHELERAEAESMEENFTTDADYDLVMLEELDDPSYQSKYYNAHELLKGLTTEETLHEVEKLDEGQVHNLVCNVLAKQPALQRSIFDLYWLEGFSEAEIGRIKRTTTEEVQASLQELRKKIVKKIELIISNLGQHV
jgi:RNA polymerase sigma factor (sigma-70 family)